MLDRFLWGKVRRISPEAPVPVVEVTHESQYPGGAANVARNLAPFCRRARIVGRVGNDEYGRQLVSLLESEGIHTAGILPTDAVPTIVKTRVVARQQQVVRVDREKKNPLDTADQERVEKLLSEAIQGVDAIICEDYGKGFLTQPLVDFLVKEATAMGIPICVDPNPENPLSWPGVHSIKPNRFEAFAAAGLPHAEPAADPLQDEPLHEVGALLRKKWQTDNLLITLGEHGMILFREGCAPYHAPTRAQEVFDVSGAGDTVIALYTLAVAAGADPSEAAEIANHAAGIVVGKLGTATLTAEELEQSFRLDQKPQ